MRSSHLLATAVLGAALALRPTAAAADDGWRWPLPAPHEVVRGFDPPAQPWLAGHRGVDLAGRAGGPVRAAGAGVVSFAGSVGGVAVVAIRHPGGLETTYQPVRASVRRGARVTVGAVIGRLVRAGGHCPPRACLHWGLRRGTDYLDPLALVGAARLRLLPLGRPGYGGPGDDVLALSAAVAALPCGLALRRGRRRRPTALSRAGR